MKKSSIKSPISLLLSIVDDDIALEVEKYLSKQKLSSGIIFNCKGTAESEIADIFGFGMDDKSVIACIIPVEKKDKIVSDVNEITGVEKDNYGLNMVIKVQSSASNLLEFMNIKVGSDGQNN